jgi:hypothetical protein
MTNRSQSRLMSPTISHDEFIRVFEATAAVMRAGGAERNVYSRRARVAKARRHISVARDANKNKHLQRAHVAAAVLLPAIGRETLEGAGIPLMRHPINYPPVAAAQRHA